MLRHRLDKVDEVTRVRSLCHLYHSRERHLALERLLVEDFMHVGTKDSHVETVIDTATVDSVLKEAENLLPIRSTTLIVFI